jgi:hypothetical protein
VNRRHVAAVAAIVALFALISGTGITGVVVLAIPVAVAAWFRVSPGLLVAGAVATSVFSENTGLMGFPVAPSRILLAAGLASLAIGFPLGHDPLPRLRWRSVHTAFEVTTVVAVMSLVGAGAPLDTNSAYQILDKLGLIPFVLFSLAPVLYPNDKERSRLAAVLVVLGWYLAITALLEGVGLKNLTWPSYINDPNVGLHFDRARGPFAEATGNGLGLIAGVTGAVIGIQIWKSTAARRAAWALLPLSLAGMLYTYTRSVWIAGGLAVVIAIAGNPATRKFLVPLALAGGVAVVIAFTVVPGVRDAAEERASDERPVWDRKNLSNAALNAFKDHPLTGVGYGQFGAKIDTLLTQADTFPLTGAQTQAHNLFLSQLAETGLVGFVPWILAFVLAIVMPALRRGSPHLRPWRQGLQMYAAAWLVVAMLTPMALAFPNYLLWLLAGIVAAPYTSWPLDADRAATRRRRVQA